MTHEVRVAYLTNIGTRDVQYRDRPLERPRSEGWGLLQRYGEVRGELAAPIAGRGLEFVLDEVRSVHRVVLFVTDQPEGTPEFHRERDTLHLGELLGRMLSDRFGARILRVVCEPMRFNPADYNRTLGFYRERLPLLVPPEEVDAVYVAPVGGTDASNAGLTLNAVRIYRERCQFIYVMESGPVQVLRLQRELLAEYARHEARAHLERCDFVALRETMERADLGRRWHREVCAYADARARFDFQGADAALERALQSAEGLAHFRLERRRTEVAGLLGDLTAPTSSAPRGDWERWLDLQRRLLRELFFNLVLKIRQAAWVDAVARIFRLYEAALRLCFERETGHSTERRAESGYADFEAALAADTDLETHLKAEGAGPGPNTLALRKILAFWCRQAGEARYTERLERLKPLKELADTLQRLAELRNKSIIAHGHQGIGRADIEHCARMPVKDLLEMADGALRALGVVMEENDPFREAAGWLRVGLEEAAD
jgi:hypothetical protein